MPKVTRRTALGAAAVATAAVAERAAGLGPEIVERDELAFRGDPNRRWAVLVDLRRCVGCQSCTVSCAVENRLPAGTFRTVVSDYEVVRGGAPRRALVPRMCNHCEDPACTTVCPTEATYRRADGVVVVNNTKCVGCAACVQACPYEGRSINPETGTAEKCTLCAHRIDRGLLPACVETCVGGARVFGDLNDPASAVSILVRTEPLQALDPAAGTRPRIRYVGLDSELASRPARGRPTLWRHEDVGVEETTRAVTGEET
ncbi:MAG TPA: 4Fe-4S dicluster domain-containing protein [Anaeromyxobacteraceae bacterium]|nr:4Fe-4S dicluster domain-containing protein [Anaeromyxobacteraceae bacterium]